MPDRSGCVLFCARFVVVFGLLVLPWPGLRSLYRDVFQTQIRFLLQHLVLNSTLIVVSDHRDVKHPWVDTEIALVDLLQAQPNGTIRAKGAAVDSRSLGWMPNAMIVALLAATPLSRTRRWKALLTGVLGVNIFVSIVALICVGDAIFQASTPNWWSLALSHAHRMLAQSLSASFVFPALLWIGYVAITRPFYSCPAEGLRTRRQIAKADDK